jgi:hypothetical protein
VADAEIIEQPQRFPGEVADLGVGALGLELTDDDDREDDIVLVESRDRTRVCEQHARVEDVGATGSSRSLAGRRRWAHPAPSSTAAGMPSRRPYAA